MSLTRVWNITDGGQPGVKSHNRMVLGESLKPGRSAQIDSALLEGATKLQADVAAKMLHIGKRPPDWYANLKRPPHAVADARRVTDKGEFVGKKVAVATGHGALPAAAMAADVSEKIEEAAPEEATEEATEEVTSEEAPSEESSSRGGRRARKRR